MSNFVSNQVLLRVSHKHEAVMMHMLQFPQQSLNEVAAIFDMTPNYLSILVHSDTFQAKFQELKKEHFHVQMESLPKKIEALANLALDRWGEEIASSADPKFIKDSADRLLQRLGYGATKGVQVDINVPATTEPSIAKDAIDAANRARATLRAIKATALEGEFHEITPN